MLGLRKISNIVRGRGKQKHNKIFALMNCEVFLCNMGRVLRVWKQIKNELIKKRRMNYNQQHGGIFP